jgi:ABC-type nickel/cobalt efflux system permease component RcnA
MKKLVDNAEEIADFIITCGKYIHKIVVNFIGSVFFVIMAVAFIHNNSISLHSNRIEVNSTTQEWGLYSTFVFIIFGTWLCYIVYTVYSVIKKLSKKKEELTK